MGLKEWYMKRTVREMSKEEKQGMMEKMMDEFFASMTSEEKKELMQQMMPKMMEGMTAEDKQELMSHMMPAMMSKMFGGEGGIPNRMMQMMTSMINGERKNKEEKNQSAASIEAHTDFNPWKCCPCSKLCEEGFKKQHPF